MSEKSTGLPCAPQRGSSSGAKIPVAPPTATSRSVRPASTSAITRSRPYCATTSSKVSSPRPRSSVSGEVRVLVDVADPGNGELVLVLAAVEDRHLEAAVRETLDDERAGRARAADDQGARGSLRRTIACHDD